MKKIVIMYLSIIIVIFGFGNWGNNVYAQENTEENVVIEVNSENILEVIDSASKDEQLNIKLTDNIEISSVLTILEGQKISIDLAGFDITATYIDNYGYLEILGKGNIKSASDYIISNQETGVLYLKGGTITKERLSTLNGGVTITGVKNYGFLYMKSTSISISGESQAQTARTMIVGIEANGGTFEIEGGNINCKATATRTSGSAVVVARAYGILQTQGIGSIKDGSITATATSTNTAIANAVCIEDGNLEVSGGILRATDKGVALNAKGGSVILGVDDGVTDYEYPKLSGGGYDVSIGEDAKVSLYDGAPYYPNKINGTFYENFYEILITYMSDSDVWDTRKVLWGESFPEIAPPEKKGNVFEGWFSGGDEYTSEKQLYSPTTVTAKWSPTLIEKIELSEKEITCTEGDEINLDVLYYPVNNGDDETIIWETSDESIVKIDNNNPKAIGAGTVIITARLANNYDISAECLVIVEHNYEFASETEPTCVRDGEKKYVCKSCGKIKTEVLRANGHSYETTITKATTSDNGSIVSTCSICGEEESREIIYHPKTVKLSKTNYIYDGKIHTPSVTIVGSNGKVISSSDYTVSYSSGRKNIGQYAVKITLKGNYSGTLTQGFAICPKGTSISKIKSDKKGFTASWKKQATQTTGYQIQYSTSKTFRSGVKTSTITKNKTVSKKVTKLKAKKTYYVRVRTYKTVKVNGKSTKIYSSWSKAKSVKTK